MKTFATALSLVSAAVLAGGLLSGCSTSSPDVIQRSDAQRMSQVQDAVVLNVRPVTVEGSQSGIGGIAGGVVGGVAGSSVGGRREGVVAGTVAAVAGAALGNMIERNTTREEALEILVQLRNGERVALVQAKGNENFQPGDAVIVVSTGGKHRVARNPMATADKPAKAEAERPVRLQEPAPATAK
ncbi:glycine zipper 2TM domain-containing protein [Roseateles sp. BYS180W]|uniref:Glycine zipper 2TM domain-containing protein n=1 Tax=Roseateles rivi TaxID=3299028 RepID=A0ABW7FRK2_9BURK